MDSVLIAQLTVKLVKYVPFVTSAVLLVLCRAVLAPRHRRTAILFGATLGVALVAWLTRHFLEQAVPRAVYQVEPTAGAIFLIGSPAMAYDILMSAAIVLAYVCVARATASRTTS